MHSIIYFIYRSRDPCIHSHDQTNCMYTSECGWFGIAASMNSNPSPTLRFSLLPAVLQDLRRVLVGEESFFMSLQNIPNDLIWCVNLLTTVQGSIWVCLKIYPIPLYSIHCSRRSPSHDFPHLHLAGALGTFREAIGMNDNGPVIPQLGDGLDRNGLK